MRCLRFVLAVLAICAVTPPVRAGETGPTEEALRAAVAKAIPLLEKGAAGAAEKRTCFTCHNQALPVMALVEAQGRGFEIDEKNLERQLEHTAKHLQRGKQNYLEGRGQGGRVITAGYALWALEAGGREPDDVTAAVAGWLLKYQKDADHWRHPGQRPPTSGSDFTTSYVALRGLAYYGTEEQSEQIEARRKQVGGWLVETEPKDTEDRVFRYRALEYVEADEATRDKAKQDLIATQRDDGGWAQTPDMTSDAYATATVLVALLRADVPADHPAIRRGLAYLVDGQEDDGSWHVVTRAKGFQTYFESGFPHGKDQFVSIAASSWATLALTLALPESAAGR